ncbi:aspartate aminotransferase family protein [Pseudomonas sp. nanlin1]|uniref:aspartate aminotransferase family protein n=1 Tax=Pseudomonas sp. nanlin1 TaxID=3040605 RepID=UPI00388E9289
MPAHHLMPTYQPLPMSFSHGAGCKLWDGEQREYLDALAGVAVTSVGHCHPRVVDAIREQAGQLLHTSNHYGIQWQQRLAARLAQVSGMEQAFFNNSGAEANETALKLARLYAQHRGIERPLVVVMENAFHGRTLGTLAASDCSAVRLGYKPLPGEFLRVPFGELSVLHDLTQAFGERICAVLVEPVQGESGVRVAPPGYLKALRALCDQQSWLLMLDEIQTGIGRTGQWFAFQHEGILPDVMTLAKALGNGIPIGACLARAQVAQLFTPGSHGSTFGGNPLACRVACTVLDIVEQEGLPANAARQGQRLLEGLRAAVGHLPCVKQLRGLGLMVGIELHSPARDLVRRAADEQRLLINVARGTTIRLLPPLTVDDGQIDEIIRRLAALLGN